jgi:hypothetical protein
MRSWPVDCRKINFWHCPRKPKNYSALSPTGTTITQCGVAPVPWVGLVERICGYKNNGMKRELEI